MRAVHACGPRGVGLSPCRGLAKNGEGGGRHTHPVGGRGAGRGGRGGGEPSAGPHARQQRVGGMAIPLVPSPQGGGRCSTHVRATTRSKDLASSPMHATIVSRVQWVLRHCSQPPPHYQSRGYGSAAIAAPGPQRTYRCWCTRRIVQALALLLLCSQPSPRYHRGVMAQAAAHARQQLQPTSRNSIVIASAPTASPLPSAPLHNVGGQVPFPRAPLHKAVGHVSLPYAP